MKRFGLKMIRFSLDRPWLIISVTSIVTTALVLLAAVPSIWPERFPRLHKVKVDTDPENMLSKDEAVRVFHNQMKKVFTLHDMVVLGVVNETHPEGVFNTQSLQHIYELAEFAKTLRWKDPKNPEKWVGVVEVDLIAPSTVDNIEPGGPGVIRFEWLMPQPPRTQEEALEIRRKAQRIPFLNGTMISEDGKAICLYIPLTAKNLSYKVSQELKKKIAEFKGDDRFFITGLPVAEDTFGVEMFIQMAVCGPLAMVSIFALMLLFFRKLSIIVSPMIVAFISVITTMALLVISGKTIHIMSSMIPVFITPIAVLDSIHIISIFFDRFSPKRNRSDVMMDVMDSLYMPMLYTSLTSAAGFASLALTPIPPVQVFGLFCAFGIMLAWVLTMTFIPAFVALIPERFMKNFGLRSSHEEARHESPLAAAMHRIGGFTQRHAGAIIVGTIIVAAVAVYGVTLIRVNDNPTKWFTKSHPIREADRVLNSHFGGTYMAYLAFEAVDAVTKVSDYLPAFQKRLTERAQSVQGDVPKAPAIFRTLGEKAAQIAGKARDVKDFLNQLTSYAEEQADNAPDDDSADAWDEALTFLAVEGQRGEVFKRPEVLNYILKLQNFVKEHPHGIVGKTNSIADIVRTVHRDLFQSDPKHFRIPDTAAGAAECLIQYQNSHRPQDLWHFVTPDYRSTSIWFQLHSGDNVDMVAVEQAVDQFIRDNPPPVPLKHAWFGLTYINVVWQQKMVMGMLLSFLGSFLVVFLMMLTLFRSALWGALCMIPLTVTIAFIYGTIGLIGKDYDMPVAVLSALSLGLAVDFAIHFLEHSRALHEKYGSWEEAARHVFAEPARAIARNIIVIAVGFLPLILAPLVPYKTVGVFLAAIMAVAGVATLLILPAMVTLLRKWMFRPSMACCPSCNCVLCMAASVTALVIIAVNVHQFLRTGWDRLATVSAVVVPVLLLACWFASLRQTCRSGSGQKAGE